MVAGDVLLFGHTHIYLAEDRDGLFVLNPGSVSLPKGGRTNTYMVYRNDVCSIKDFSGEVLATLTVV
jgi:putative phosphoesterase